MSARVEGNDPELLAQRLGQQSEDAGAEPVRVSEQGQGSLAAKVQDAQLHAAFGELYPPPHHVQLHARVSRGRAAVADAPGGE